MNLKINVSVKSKRVENINDFFNSAKKNFNIFYFDHLDAMAQVKGVETMFKSLLTDGDITNIMVKNSGNFVDVYTNSHYVVEAIEIYAKKNKMFDNVKFFYEDKPFKDKLGVLYYNMSNVLNYLDKLRVDINKEDK